jgi:hypothetical protein
MVETFGDHLAALVRGEAAQPVRAVDRAGARAHRRPYALEIGLVAEILPRTRSEADASR